MPLGALKRISIVTRIALAGGLSLLLFAVAMMFFVKVKIEEAVYGQTDARVVSAYETMAQLVQSKGAPRLVGDKLYLGTWLANGDNSLVDDVRKLTGADATLFAVVGDKPIRVATTIYKLDGSGRNLQTELVGPARIAFDEGRGFAGVSPVAGRPFLNRYEPLRDGSGRTVGIVYTGIPLTTMAATVASAMQTLFYATVVALGASLALLYIAMRPLLRVFRNAVAMAEGLAEGDVDQTIAVHSDDELGKMSRAFGAMIRYQQRMAAVADALARGDFSTQVVPVSPRDRLGVAFAHMSVNVERLVGALEASAMTDSLTGLGNRRAFDARLSSELSRAARHDGQVALALIDVDNFKGINDEYGHQHGDLVLSKLGTILQGLRAEDAAFRIGGDEFAIIFSDCHAEAAMAAVERVREKTQAELFGTTVSIGLAVSPNGLIDSDVLQRQADAALYVCKQRGRNIVTNFATMQMSALGPQQLNIDDVTRLIAARDVETAYQPIWDLAGRTILGFEALARPPGRYRLSGPQEAFDVASKIGRAHELDRVCRDAAIAKSAGLPSDALLFLNVWPGTLAREEITAQTLSEQLAKVGLRMERVVLEITERYAGPLEPVLRAARDLQRHGFKLALDDTGAGNAGLQYLSRLKVDFIKIDGAIVAAGSSDVAARGVITAIMALAKTTDAYVIAEGIEDQAMLDSVYAAFLDQGADGRVPVGGQGYFLGRPGPIGAATHAASVLARLNAARSASERVDVAYAEGRRAATSH